MTLWKMISSVEWLEIGGFPLGIGLASMANYTDIGLTLQPGEMLVLMSDGLVEAMNDQDEILGFDHVAEIVQAGPLGKSQLMLDHIHQAVARFVGNTEPHDDLTVVVITARTP